MTFHVEHPTELDRIMVEEGRMNTWLAKQVGVHKATVGSWRKGIMVPTKQNMAAVARALGRSGDGASLFSRPCPPNSEQQTGAS